MRRTTAALLFAAWAVHDAEEWFTIAPWTRDVADGTLAVPAWVRRAPWLRQPVTDLQQRGAIVSMGIIVGSAAVAGVATHGRSPWYRTVATAYGMHGVGHVLASMGVRGYTPGVVTTPFTVMPYAVWALRGHAGLTRREAALAVVGLPASLAVSHAIGATIARRWPQGWRASNSASATASGSASSRTWASSPWRTRSALAARSPQSDR